MRKARIASAIGSALALAWIGAASAAAQPPPAHGGPPWWRPHARLGIQIQSMTEELREYFGAPADRGVLVVGINPGGPAQGAGMQVGDVVVAVNGEPIESTHELTFKVAGAPAQKELAVEIVRNRKPMQIAVVPEGEPVPGLDPDTWEALRERMKRGLGEGGRELRRRLDELERRLQELERRLDQETSPPGQEGT